MPGFYCHIPFCRTKCAYCDFYSEAGLLECMQPFMRALEFEIKQTALTFPENTVLETIYIGGGSPALAGCENLASLFFNIFNTFTVQKNAEITLEINPWTDSNDLLFLKSCGINRLSLGVQSINAKLLKILGRHQPKDQVKNIYTKARAYGFDNINMDLIFGIPGQSAKEWINTLKFITALKPEHISAYALSWNENTHLGRNIMSGALKKPEENVICRMFLDTDQVLTGAGYRHYEISNFALPGFECRHNLGYWNDVPYFGAGPSAHAYLCGKRRWNIRDLKKYIKLCSQAEMPLAGEETLTQEQLGVEKISLGLRQSRGIPLELVSGKREILNALAAEKKGIIEKGFFKLTAEGFLLADEIALRFI